MLCTNYCTSVIKNLLPPAVGPPPLLTFAVCKLEKAKRETEEGTVLLACATRVCAETAGRCRGQAETQTGLTAWVPWCLFIFRM